MVRSLHTPEDVDSVPLPGEQTAHHCRLTQSKPGHNPPSHRVQQTEALEAPPVDLHVDLQLLEPARHAREVFDQEGDSVGGGEEVAEDVGEVGVHCAQCALQGLVTLAEPHLQDVLQAQHGRAIELTDQLAQQASPRGLRRSRGL